MYFVLFSFYLFYLLHNKKPFTLGSEKGSLFQFFNYANLLTHFITSDHSRQSNNNNVAN